MKLLSFLCVAFVIILGGCSLAPPIDDTVLESVTSPSGKKVAIVVKRETMLADTSLLVFAGPTSIDIRSDQPVVAITDGFSPKIWFENENKLVIQLFGGTLHNSRKSVNGIDITYK